jgi:hypothetical protein
MITSKFELVEFYIIIDGKMILHIQKIDPKIIQIFVIQTPFRYGKCNPVPVKQILLLNLLKKNDRYISAI